jgi:2-desacetyl-2-hydroxyethyl bacteriochlorophyllide A dehydrogenase
MKAIVNTGPGQLALQDVPLPEPGAGQVRVRTGACAICATDLAMIAGWARTGFPSIPGHEWAGTVDAVGDGVDPSWIGRRCVAENVLSDGGEVGFEHPGGYGEYLVTEARRLQALPAGFSLAVATLIEPLAVSVRAMHRLRLPGARGQHPAPGALVMGDGPIGLLVLVLLRRAGVEDLVLVGGRPGRLALARELGAGETCNYHEAGEDLGAALKQRLGRQFAYVVEASGSGAAARASLELAALGGRIVIVGDYGDARADFPWNHILHQEIELVGSCASAGAWPEAAALAVVGHIPLARLITHRYPAEQFERAVSLARSHRDDVVKVVLEWDGADPGRDTTQPGGNKR